MPRSEAGNPRLGWRELQNETNLCGQNGNPPCLLNVLSIDEDTKSDDGGLKRLR